MTLGSTSPQNKIFDINCLSSTLCLDCILWQRFSSLIDPSHIQPFTHSYIACSTLSITHRCRQGQFRVQVLAQGHFSMRTGGAGDQSTDLLVSGRPTLPPEPQIFFIVCFAQAQLCYLLIVNCTVTSLWSLMTYWHHNVLSVLTWKSVSSDASVLFLVS